MSGEWSGEGHSKYQESGPEKVTRNIRRVVRRRALERWRPELANYAVIPQAVWLIAKPLTERVDQKQHLQFMVPYASYIVLSIEPT
jgi:hypothetical protein